MWRYTVCGSVLVLATLVPAVSIQRSKGQPQTINLDQVLAHQIACPKAASLENCTCNANPIGPGKTGDHSHDTVAAISFSSVPSKPTSLWSFTGFQHGKEVPLKDLAGKVNLVVNVASGWGLSNTFYKGASELLNEFKGQGLQLIAVPSNQFGQQAPHSSECERNFMYKKMDMEPVSFPILDKMDLNGANAAPFFKWLREQSPNAEGEVIPQLPKVGPGEVSWNYEKFLVDAEGHVLGRYTPKTDVLTLKDKIKELLAK